MRVSVLLFMKRSIFLCVLLGVLLFSADYLRAPQLVIEAGEDVLYEAPVFTRKDFSIRFIHSVQKTPVRENLYAKVGNNAGLWLDSTEYESFGVGLPFLLEEGAFYQQGTHYIIDHMGRKFERLALRTGVGTKLTLYVDEKEILLYEEYPPGTLIRIEMRPRIAHYFKN